VKPPPTLTPHAATILTIDPGETSGWAIWVNGQLRNHGTSDVFVEDPSVLIEHLKTRYLAPYIAVVERPFLAKFGQTTMGTADQIWRKRLEQAGLGPRTVRVYPASWRCRALGKGWGSVERELVRAKEQEVACRLTGKAFMHPDAAAAVCIGQWACFAGEVLAVLPKRKA
jgi:hypothetical protein